MILIRKECQELLDLNKLGQFHVQMGEPRWSGDQTYLEIVTECGQPLVKVKGIPVKKTRYTPAEREYTVELFEQFLTKYLKEIWDFLAAKKVIKLKDTRIKRLKKQGYRGDLPVVSVGGKINRDVLGLAYDEGPFHVAVFKGIAAPRVKMIEHQPECNSLTALRQQNEDTLNTIRTFKLDSGRIKDAQVDVILYDKELKEHEVAEDRIKELTGVFESCTI